MSDFANKKNAENSGGNSNDHEGAFHTHARKTK